MREYELIMVISPEVEEENATGVVERVSKFIIDRGGEITNQDNWGTQRLAYPIQNYREGTTFWRSSTRSPPRPRSWTTP